MAPLTAAERERLVAFRAADSLADLVALTDADSEHEAYLAAKREWRDLRAREPDPEPDGLPGTTVEGEASTPAFHVHGVTHAGTDAEREYLRDHVSAFLDRGATVYCEQGIRPLYFSDLPGVRAMDDYRWALARCAELEGESAVADLAEPPFDGLGEDIAAFASRFRETAFSLIDAGSDVYGEEFERALGDVASEFLTGHEHLATGEGFTSFTLTREATEDPTKLAALQRYYETAFLPQPVEREWLRRHDRELELVTHARNERMADYAVYHSETATEVHLVVGAAHQPGVAYYLRQHRDGERDVDGFELV